MTVLGNQGLQIEGVGNLAWWRDGGAFLSAGIFACYILLVMTFEFISWVFF